MKRLLVPNLKAALLAAGAAIVMVGLGGCAEYADDSMYSSGVYNYGWGGPYYGSGYYGGYYGGGYYPGGGGGNRPGYNPGDRPRVEHHGNFGPGNANIRPSYGGGGRMGGGGRGGRR